MNLTEDLLMTISEKSMSLGGWLAAHHTSISAEAKCCSNYYYTVMANTNGTVLAIIVNRHTHTHTHTVGSCNLAMRLLHQSAVVSHLLPSPHLASEQEHNSV